MSEAWRRPFRSQRAKDSRWFGEGGFIFRDHHIWYNMQSRELLGLPSYRLAGYRSVANSEFSTRVFEVPSKPLWVNADVDASSGITFDEFCSAVAKMENSDLKKTLTSQPEDENSNCCIS